MKILVVVDMQNDFLDDAVLGNKACRDIVDRIKGKIKSPEYDRIFATRDTHTAGYLATQEGRNLPVAHCIEGTRGWEIEDGIMKELQNNNAVIVDKPTFGSVELGQLIKALLENEEIQQEECTVEFVGVCTGICVISNALTLKAFLPECKIKVDEKGCACVSDDSHKIALEAMKLCQIEII